MTAVRYFHPDRTGEAAGRALYQALSESGYIDVLSSLLHRDQPQQALRGLLTDLPEGLQAACTLLQLGGSVATEALPGRLSSALVELEPAGLVSTEHGTLRLRGLCLSVQDGLLYFSDLPARRQNLYYGTDSLALASRLQVYPGPDRRVLDVCAGPGIQGLLSSRSGASVTFVEANPLALSLCQCNVRLNGLQEQAEFVGRPVEELHGDGTYDYVFANPPLIPVPGPVDYPFVGDGGPDGLAVTRKILATALPLLAEGGRLTTIGMSSGSEQHSAVEGLVHQASQECEGLSFCLVLLGQIDLGAGSAWLHSMRDSVALYGGRDMSAEELLELYREQCGTTVYTYALSVVNSGAPSTTVIGPVDSTSGQTCWWV
ncbi:methyltransferase [Actinomyces wuliandei]|uniref:methyltransferase n=1 Tax=Actinomyces wuliandei TaxID=2057743 RepID=UPI001119DF50|nr:class I SAM-dependent methyltransferase [Actinomyces wuliandei]